MALYEPARHEPLTATPWDEGRVRSQIEAIVEEAEAALRAHGRWPPHPLDDRAGLPDELATLWLGAAGVVWALRDLGTGVDLTSVIERAVARYVEAPDFGEHAASLWMGESGIRAVALLVTGDGRHVERLLELVRANARNETNDLMWGAPGTMLAARSVLEETGDERLRVAWRESAETLWERWDDDGLWTQHIRGRSFRSIGAGHGFAANVRVLLQGGERVAEIAPRAASAAAATAIRESGLANWPMAAGERLDERGEIRVQWCHGSPGVVASLWDVAEPDLMLAGGELTWVAGPLTKGGGLCHGTAGNGYAFLKLFALTRDEIWLERARSFAVHALEQVARARQRYGRGRFSLWTGDVGTALYARACVVGDHRFPTIDYW